MKFDVRALSSIGIFIEFDDPQWDTSFTSPENQYETEFETWVSSVKCAGFHDTVTASHIVNSADRHGLKELGIKYLSYSDADEKFLQKQVLRASNVFRDDSSVTLGYNRKGKRQTKSDYWLPKLAFPEDDSLDSYADSDAERTILLWKLYEELLHDTQYWEHYKRAINLIPVVYRMEHSGISYGVKRTESKVEELNDKITTCEDRCRSLLDREEVNLNSSKQLSKVLYEDFKLPVLKTTENGAISTDKDTLKELLDVTTSTKISRFLSLLLELRTYQSGLRYLNSYNYAYYPINRHFRKLYPSLNQTGTRTTRLSSSNPNGQNVGKVAEVEIGNKTIQGPRLRDVFGPVPGKIWYSLDYSQLELRIFAGASKEQSIINALNTGHDYHGFVAERIFNKPSSEITSQERTIAKNTNFALIFGAKEKKVNETAGIPNAYELFSGQFPNITSYTKEIVKEAKKNGYIETLFGYPLKVPSNKPYVGVSYKIQGTAGDVIKRAMKCIDKLQWFSWRQIKMILQIHDELIIETSTKSVYNDPYYIRRIMDCMEHASDEIDIPTPVTCKRITHDWGHGEEIKVTGNEFIVVKD